MNEFVVFQQIKFFPFITDFFFLHVNTYVIPTLACFLETSAFVGWIILIYIFKVYKQLNSSKLLTTLEVVSQPIFTAGEMKVKRLTSYQYQQ